MLQSVARASYRNRRLVVVAWIVLLVGTFLTANAIGGAFHTTFRLSGSESQDAVDLLQRSGFDSRTGEQAQIVFESGKGVNDPTVRAAMDQLFTTVAAKVPSATVLSPYSTEGAGQVSAHGTIAYAELDLADRSEQKFSDAADQVRALTDRVRVPGLHLELGGNMFATDTGSPSEAIGILAAMVILLLAFGSLLAMGLPILTALFGIGTGTALVLGLRSVISMPDFTTAAVAMVGLGVGIDYALFIVTRYRENLRDGMAPERAVVHSIDTAGRAVLFAGSTVIISMLGLILMKLDSARGVAVAISLAVLATMVASITLLPAALGFVGRNIDRLGLPHRRRSGRPATFWRRWSRTLQRRPWPAAIAATLILLVLAAPALSMRLGFSDNGNRPASDTTRRAYDLVSTGFGPGFNGPLLLAVRTPGGPADAPALEQLRGAVASTPGVAGVSPVQSNPYGTVAVFQAFPTTAPQSERTSELVHRLRDDVVPPATAGSDLHVAVGGLTAAATDFAAYTAERLPIFIGAVLVLSFLLLMTVFRSVLVALKAVVMNVLSIGAAYGVVVAVFQWGWFADALGLGKPGPVEAWAPMFLFAVVFGLSMDYEVFLLSRVREEYDRTHDNASAVANGLAVTARVITAAAAIMVCVFGSFVLGSDRSLRLFGLGLAVAVLVDATVVRLLLVPATMELLGDRNWWMPRWLDRVLPRVHVEAPVEVPAGAPAGAGPEPAALPVTARNRRDAVPSGR
jgi:putative drug exporter of the RND superfamily